MDKEREIKEIAKIISNSCDREGIAKRCPERISEALIEAGYGDIKQAVREFAEKLKVKFTKSTYHILGIYKNIDELLAEAEK